MNLSDYLLREVKPEEFQELENRQADIISDVMDEFNDHWKPKVKDVRVSFKYNPQRNLVGIYINRNGQEGLIVERRSLTDEEEAVVGSLYGALEKNLDRLRLPKEEWVSASAK